MKKKTILLILLILLIFIENVGAQPVYATEEALNEEISQRQSSDQYFLGAINANSELIYQGQSNLAAAVTALQTADNSILSAISAEQAARNSVDTTLQGEIDAHATLIYGEMADRASAVSSLQEADNTILAAISAEQAARNSVDTTLQGEIDAHATLIYGEMADRASAVSALQQADNTILSAINTERADRSSVDENLQEEIDTHATLIYKEQADRATAVSSLQEADKALNSKIESYSVVADDNTNIAAAHVAALAAVNYQTLEVGQWQISTGFGFYKGKTAESLGLAARFTERISVSASVSTDFKTTCAFNVGANFVFGKSKTQKTTTTSNSEIISLQEQNEQLAQQIQVLTEALAEMQKQIEALKK